MPRTPRVVAVALLLVLVAAPAHAGRWVVDDPSSDVTGWHHDPEPEPCGTDSDLNASAHGNEDLVRFSAQHTRTELRFVARFRDFDETLGQGLSIHIQTPTRAWQLAVDRRWWITSTGERWKVTAELSKPFPEPADDEVSECGTWLVIVHHRSCKIARTVDLGTNTITAAMPRSCIGNPGWVRVGARTTGWDFPRTGTRRVTASTQTSGASTPRASRPGTRHSGPSCMPLARLRTGRRRTAPG